MRAMLPAAMIAWLAAVASPCLADDWSRIRIGTEGAFPPWNAIDGDGEVVGFEIDLARDLCRRMAARCEIVTQKWNGMIPALTTRKYDAIMAGMTVTEERERSIVFSRCYGNDPAIFLVHVENAGKAAAFPVGRLSLATLEPEDQTMIHELRQGFAGATIGTRIATAPADFVLQFFDDVADIRPYDTLDDMINDLDAGRIDAVFLSKRLWKELIENEDYADLIQIGPDIAGGLLGVGVAVGFRRQDADLKAMFDDAIASAIADGTVSRLSKRWFGYDLSC